MRQALNFVLIMLAMLSIDLCIQNIQRNLLQLAYSRILNLHYNLHAMTDDAGLNRGLLWLRGSRLTYAVAATALQNEQCS